MVRTTFSLSIRLFALAGLWGLVGCRHEEPPDVGPVAAAEESPAGKDSTTAAQPPAGEHPSTAATPNAKPANPAMDGDPPKRTQPSPGAVRPAIPVEVNTAISELIAKWDTVQSASATLKTNFERTQGQRERQEGEGTRDTLKKDGKVLMRSAYRNGVALEKKNGEWIVTGQIVLKVFDGEFLYVDDERHEGRTATKARPSLGQLQPIGGRRLFAGLRGVDEIRLLSDETIDGKPVYVFEAKAGGGTITSRHYVDKETGILVKLTRADTLASIQYSFELTDIKVNVDFDEGHFTYTPPEGVEVQDLTRRGAVRVPPPMRP